jgi:hypothetical protein
LIHVPRDTYIEARDGIIENPFSLLDTLEGVEGDGALDHDD